MIATIYTNEDGKAAFDIIATRDADITEATRTMMTNTTGPGALRLFTITRAGALLEAAQRKIDSLRENTADWFAYKDRELGSVTVAWVD